MAGSFSVSREFMAQADPFCCAASSTALPWLHAAILAPRIFNVVDDLPVLRSEIMTWLSEELRIPLSSSEGIEEKRTGSNKRVSNAKLRALGWAPIYPNYVDAFTRSIFRQQTGHGHVI